MSVPVQLPLPLPRPQPGAGRRDSLGDRLCALIERRGRPLEVGHVVAQILRMRSCPERLGRRLVAEIVDQDERLAWVGRDLVGLAPPGWTRLTLAEAGFCVVDLETTGGSPGRSKVTEIGAVRVRGLEIEERFSTLVDPGRPIPPVITGITGITDEMVAGQPDIQSALADFVAFSGLDVLVCHNAPFDLRFLNYERRRLAGRYFTQPWLDTLALARRLLADRVERHDLRTLAAWAGTRATPCHRALPDAEATAELLIVLCHLLMERGQDSLQRAVAVGQTGGARYAHKLVLAEDLPTTAGVYLMRDRLGEVLYVGKATNLRRRVRAYFGPDGRHGRLIGRALEALDRVDHEPCGSEFEALWRESRLLRELRPPCNRRGLGAGGCYLKLTDEPMPRLYTVARTADDGARYYGPLRSPRVARLALEALHLLIPLRRCQHVCAPGLPARLLYEGQAPCAGPCGADGPGDYAAAVADARRLLEADVDEAVSVLAPALERAAQQGRIGPDDQPRIDALLGSMTALARLRRAAARRAVLVEPSARPGVAAAFFVAGARVVHRVELPAKAWRGPALAALARLRAAEHGPPLGLDDGDLDEVLIVSERMRQREGSPCMVPLEPGRGDHEVLAGVGLAVRVALAGDQWTGEAGEGGAAGVTSAA